MPTTNLLAQFGRDAGRGITEGVDRYRQNRLASLARDDRQEQIQYERQQLGQQEQRDFVRQATEGMMSAPPEQRPQMYQGFLQEAQRRGYDIEGDPTEYSDEILHQMAGATGVQMPSADQAGARFGQVNPRDFTTESLSRFQQSGDFQDLERHANRQFRVVSGSDGRDRLHVLDPATGGYVPASAEQAQAIMGGGGGAGAQGVGAMPQAQPGPDTTTSRTPEEQARLTAESTPPKGYRFNEQGRLIPQEGSPESRKLEQTRRASTETLGRKVPGILRDITRAMESAESSGPVAGAFAQPGEGAGRMARASAAMSPAYELNQHLESIKSNISIDELQSMREASPTGGALGQVPVRQQEFLMQVQGSLQPTLQPEVLRENLTRVQNNYLNLYLNALYGDEQEWQSAIADGRASQEDMQAALQEKDDMRGQYMRETEFGEFGERRQSEPQGGASEGTVIQNPQTGEQLILRNGQWVPHGG